LLGARACGSADLDDACHSSYASVTHAESDAPPASAAHTISCCPHHLLFALLLGTASQVCCLAASGSRCQGRVGPEGSSISLTAAALPSACKHTHTGHMHPCRSAATASSTHTKVCIALGGSDWAACMFTYVCFLRTDSQSCSQSMKPRSRAKGPVSRVDVVLSLTVVTLVCVLAPRTSLLADVR